MCSDSVMCMVRLLLLLCSLPRQSVLFVCLFQILGLAPSLPLMIEALSIPSPWTDISIPPQAARRTSPT